MGAADAADADAGVGTGTGEGAGDGCRAFTSAAKECTRPYDVNASRWETVARAHGKKRGKGL